MFKLLIAEDVKTVRETLVRAIPWETMGISLLGAAENGEEALAWLDREAPDLLLTDIGMPKMNGLALIEAFKARKPDIRCIILSGLNEFEHARTAIQLQVQAYILKPIDPDEITQVFTSAVAALRKAREDNRGSDSAGSGMGGLSREALSGMQGESRTQEELRVHEELRVQEELPHLAEALSASGDWNGGLKKKKLVEQALQYMKEGYLRKELALSEVAAAVGLSDKYLNVLVKEVTGMTINHSIIRLRMEEAARLLKDPAYKIYEICDLIGYTDQDHFREVFKKQFGVTPTAYRNRYL